MLLLGILCTFDASYSGASEIEFKWPIPARASVWMSGTAESTHFVAQYVIRVDPTPFPDELRVHSENFEIPLLDVHGAEGSPLRTDLESGIEAVVAAPPPIMISRSGEYLRFAGMDDFVNDILGSLRKSPTHADVPKAAWTRIEAMLRSPETSEQIEREASVPWRAWIDAWTGSDLELGEERVVEGSFSFAGRSVPVRVSLRNQGAADLDSELVWLQLESVVDGEAWVKALEQGARSDGILGEDDPDGQIRSASRVEQVTAVLEQDTARPSYARYVREEQIHAVDGSSWERRKEAEYYFEWSKPLGRADRRDVVPDSVIAWFQQGRLEEAGKLVAKAAAEGSRHSDLHAYKSDIFRRLEEPGEALYAARRAVALDPGSSFAHHVLAEALMALSHWNQTHDDSAWAHLHEGVACDSTDGNVWLSLHQVALRRGDRHSASRSLHRLLATNFFTPAVLAHARWMVQGLPERSLLLTNGDLDTYPLWCLQEVEGLRPDVAVVNVSLLNAPWYVRYVRDRYGVPLPLGDAELDSLYSRWSDSKRAPASRIVDDWATLRRYGKLSNPLRVSITVDRPNIPPGLEKHLCLAGSSWEFVLDTSRTVDTTAVRLSLASIRPEDFRGRVISERDRSPVRGRSTLLHNIVELCVQYAEALLAADRRGEAGRALRQAESMAARAGFETAVADRIRAAWASLEQSSK